ncbi:MarR family transcriptional regulator [Herbiconiux sp. VKM Ac-1786]|jgi:DNA-binding MarR family transcriptional regulator|uniref:MarR family winged helix-turn-helix transcriptional regulator n=1 Tax=Herbiconiux sp. VKM Ac-1786 TaxID=2783824 RepID=UPI00188B7C06|nr:MarR family transcriptional regulator [Herbiconiux sp. VKM Ac-1786]MBF4572605.1 MarR family transcriptional regulator [Herbiconiux sp. VKM Ac-1786]
MLDDRAELLDSGDVLDALEEYLASRSALRRLIRTETELSDSAWNALLELRAEGERGGSLTPKELASRLDLRSASITALVDKLVRLGYVDRSASSTDRRGLTLALTPEGREFTDRHDRAHLPELAVAARLAPAAAALVERVLADLADAAGRSFPVTG